MTRVPFHALLVASVAILAGCSGALTESSADAVPATLEAIPSAPAIATAEESQPSDARTPDLEAFCELALPMLVLVEREHVGSEAHVAQFTALGEVAPEDLVDVIANLERHFDVAVSPSDPDSQDSVNFPASIREDGVVLTEAITERCDAAV
ncbi:hypothetical protein [Demequina sp.]|uniref:hypothetical protein n=1 Tax=Demequina sp. TaxID=2050685 RepID=UPI0025BD84A1|nr:hypothetical protein [Demequina sp.]